MQRFKLIFLILCVLLVSGTMAFATTDEHPLPWDNFGWRVLNFVLFVGILTYFFGKKIVGFFKGRTQGIAAEISTLEERKAAAQKNLAEVEQRIANLEKERLSIIADYKAQGETLKASILEQAHKSAAAISAQAKTAAQNEISQAVEAIRAELADKVVEATETLLAKKLSTEEHTKLVDKYLTKVVLN